jgi:CBS domain-containing protein
MLESGVRHLAVIDVDGHVVGVLSDYDLRASFRDPLWVLGEEEPTPIATLATPDRAQGDHREGAATGLRLWRSVAVVAIPCRGGTGRTSGPEPRLQLADRSALGAGNREAEPSPAMAGLHGAAQELGNRTLQAGGAAGTDQQDRPFSRHDVP